MPRPVWKGFISFGLVAIPVSIVSAEEKHVLHFHLLDSRDHSRVHYKRINTETGKEVPWDKIVKAYEFEKDNYVVMNDEDFQKASPEAFKSIEIDEFVKIKDIDILYFDKPYYLVPEGKNKKAYVLLREALKKTNTVGVGKVIIRTKEYLCLILAHDHALVLNLIRFKEDIRDEAELNFPTENLKTYKISEKELSMANDLVAEMTKPWDPSKYHDEYQEALLKSIHKKTPAPAKPTSKAKIAAKKDDVIDFISLLKKSMKEKTTTKNTTGNGEKSGSR